MRAAIFCLGIATLTVAGVAVRTVQAHFVRDPTFAALEAREEPAEVPELRPIARRTVVAPKDVFGGVPATTIPLPDSIGAVPIGEVPNVCPCDESALDDRAPCPTPTMVEEQPPHEIVVDGRRITVASSLYVY